MITPILYNNAGLKSWAVLPSNSSANNSHVYHVRGGGGPQPVSLIKFEGARPGDVFIKKAASIDDLFTKLLAGINEKIKKQLCAYTPEKLDNDIKTVLKEVPEANERQVLIVMQRLTQWANYNCLPELAQRLSAFNVSEIANTSPLNQCFNYLHKSKRLFNLNCHGENIAFITSKSELPLTLEKKHHKDTSFINLEGFEDGVNLFSSDNELADKTIAMLRKVQNYRYYNPDITFKEALFMVLNNYVYKSMRENGYNLKVISRHQPETRENILAQMLPYAPSSPDEIKTTIETIAKFFGRTKLQTLQLRNNIADYYECKLNVFSKQRIIDDLSVLKTKINKYLKKHKISEDNLYYVIPDELGANKSFGLITYMFAQNNSIDAKKIMRLNCVSDLKNYPENSVFVILDDFSGSGDTLIQASNYYLESWRLNKPQHILFCPLSACEGAIDKIQGTIDIVSREKLDKVLTVKNNIQYNPKTEREISLDNYFLTDEKAVEAFGFEGYKNENLYSGSTVFPYMAPDNNSDLSSFITRYFLPHPNGIKSKHLEFDTIVEQIEKMLNFMNKSSKD